MPAKSKKQANAARVALAAKEGKFPKSKLKKSGRRMCRMMTKGQLKGFTKMESLSEKLSSVLFESAQQCLGCQHYSNDDHECTKTHDVIQAHGIDRFKDWMKYPDDLNGCNYYAAKE